MTSRVNSSVEIVSSVSLSFGINHIFAANAPVSEIDNELAAIEQLVAALQAEAPACKVLLVTTTPGAESQAIFDAAYSAPLDDQWRWEQCVRLEVQRQVEEWVNRQSEGVYVANATTCVDTDAGYAADGIHPTTSGYLEMARGIYAGMRRCL